MVHFICPQQAEEGLCAGTTTFIGGGTGPVAGSTETTVTSCGTWNMHRMLEAADELLQSMSAYLVKVRSV